MLKNLRKYRKKVGFTQEELAEKLNISRQAVTKWETGSSYPEIDKLLELSELLKVSLESLLKDKEEECNINVDNDRIYLNEQIVNFLCRAKKVTYAGKGAESESTRPKSHDLMYGDGEYKYIDTYLGGEKFSGEEGGWAVGVRQEGEECTGGGCEGDGKGKRWVGVQDEAEWAVDAGNS